MMKTVSGRGQAQQDGQVGVLPQGAEGFLRAVGRGGKAVGSQAHPGQDRDQGHLVKEMRVLDEFGIAEYGAGDLPENAFGGGTVFRFHADSPEWRPVPWPHKKIQFQRTLRYKFGNISSTLSKKYQYYWPWYQEIIKMAGV